VHALLAGQVGKLLQRIFILFNCFLHSHHKLMLQQRPRALTGKANGAGLRKSSNRPVQVASEAFLIWEPAAL
jgi:hypothetical protein